MDTTEILNKLMLRQDLTHEESRNFLIQVMKGEVSSTQIAAILIALRMKGESVEEIVGFISAMREQMKKVSVSDAIDVCGTGGDGVGTVNVSTAVSFVVAGAGVTVAKHGNRAASGKCGAADVLEALGVNIMLTPEQAEKVIKKVGTVFLFAPLYHPATKYVIGVRKELKVRTIFNFLGPFLSPASCKRQLIGVPNQLVAMRLAEVGKALKYEYLLIVTGEDGLDEVSVSAYTVALEVKQDNITKFVIDPQDYGIKKVSQQEIVGGDAKQNSQDIRDILKGQSGPKRDIVILNSACALYVAGMAKDIKEGIRLAEYSIDSGKAAKILEQLIVETQKYA